MNSSDNCSVSGGQIDVAKSTGNTVNSIEVKVSVIVSVSGSAKYLKQCLDSVFSQNIEGLEVIAVDDCSSDDSSAILAEYASKHENLRLLKDEDAGLGDARNLGIKNASGRYVAFVDGCDYYPDGNVLSDLYDFAESCELNITGGYREVIADANDDESGHKPLSDDPVYMLLKNEKENLVCTPDSLIPECMPQAYLFNAAFLKDHNFVFPAHPIDYVSLFLWASVLKAGEFGLVKRCCYVNRFKCTDVILTPGIFDDLIGSCGHILRYSSENNLEALHERIYRVLNITMKNKLVLFIKQTLSVTIKLCCQMCYELSALNYEILSKVYNRPCCYSPLLESSAEVLATMLYRNETAWNDTDEIMNSLNSLRSDYLQHGGESSHIDIFLIKVLFCLWRPAVPHYIRMAVYEAVKDNAFSLDKLFNDSRLSVNRAKLKSIIPAVEFNERYQSRNNEKHVEVVKSAEAAENIILSVIIPVYNVEKYLEECLDSVVVLNRIPGMEVICVNDGSEDGSLEILKNYADKYRNITVLSQDNAGLSAARNVAMKYARGRYIHFLDSDDAITQGCYQKSLELMEKQNLDVLFFNASGFYEEPALEKEYPSYRDAYRKNQIEGEIISGIEYYCKRTINGNFIVQACMYISRRSFLEENHLIFPQGIIYEDNLFTIELMVLASRVMHVNDEFYRRRVRRGSLTINKTEFKHAFGYFITYKKLLDFTRSLDISAVYKDYLFDRCYLYRNLAVDRLDRIQDETGKFYYLALDSDLSQQFFNDVANTLFLKNTIKSKNDGIVQKNVKIAEINEVVKQKNSQIIERNEVIKQKNTQIAEKNEVIKQKDALIAEINKAVKQISVRIEGEK